jgi:hypothetical protein
VDSGVLTCAVADLNTGAVANVNSAVIDRRCLRDDEFAILDRTVGWGHQQNASPCAQANRLFYRTRGALRCIGDMKQPFPTPKDCPANARVKDVPAHVAK